MADDFDPDAYLAAKRAAPAESAFDPDAYLRSKAPRERGVGERMLMAPIESLKESGQAIAKPFIPPKTKKEAEERGGILSSAGETGSAILSAAGAIPGAILSPAQSLISSGLAAITPGPKTSEQKYEEWMPKVGTAFMGLGRMPGVAGTGRFPMPEPILARTTRVPAKTREAEVGRFLEAQATDPAKLRADLAAPGQEIVPGSQPTTHQLTGQLGQQERVAARTDPEMVEAFKQRQAAQNRARQQALESAEGTGSPAEVSQHLRNELNRQNAANEAAVRAAEQRAFEAQQRLGAEYDPTLMGERMRREIEIAEAAARERERAMWDRVNPEGTLVADPAGIQAVERGIYSPARMTPTARAGVSQAEAEISNLIQNYGRVIPFQELTDLRSLVSARMREERMARGASSPSFVRLVRMRQGIEDALVSSVSDVQPTGVARGAGAIGAQERVQAASAATRERAQQFNPLRNITRSEAGEAYKLGPSSVPGKIVQPGAKGYDSVSNYLRAVGNDAGMSTVQDALLGRLRAEVFDRAGTPQQATNRLEGFFRRYGDTLRALDERDGGAFSQRLRSAGGAQGAVEAAQLRQRTAAADQATDQFRRLTGLTEDADIARTIGGIFGRQDSVQRAADLMRRLAGNPAAQEGARRAVVQHMRNVLTGDVLVGDTPNVRAQAFQKYVRLNKPALQQILRPEQIETLELIARDLLRETRTNQTKAVGGGSDTYQMFKAGEQKQGVIKGLAKKLTSPLVGKVITHWLAGTFGGPAASVALAVGEGGIEAGRAARAGRRAQEAIDIQRMIDEALLDPAKAKEYLGKTHTYKARTPGAKAILGYEAGAAEKQRQSLLRQAGGGVPAIGGTGGRSPGATTPAGARAARQGASQALQDGGAAREQEAGQGSRERLGAALSGAGPFGGSPAGGGEMTSGTFKGKAKGPEPLTRQKVVDTLRQHGVTDPEVLKGWTEGWPHTAESRARGGSIEEEPDEAEVGPASEGLPMADWNKVRRDPGEYRPNLMRPEMRPEEVEAIEGWRGPTGRRFLQGGGGTDPTPPPVSDPTPPPDVTSNTDTIAGSDFIQPPLPFSEQNQQRKKLDPMGMFGLFGGAPDFGAAFSGATPEQQTQASALFNAASGAVGMSPATSMIANFRPFADGGEVEEEKLPSPGGVSRGLGRQDEPLPVMRRNKAGETLPGYIAKSWGERLAHLMGTPGRVYREGMTDEDVEFGPAMAMQMMGTSVPRAGPGLGIFGGRGARTANLPMLEKAEQMRAKGASPEEIWSQTGWYRGPEGKPRFEISDAEARLAELDPDQLRRARQSGTAHRFSPALSDVLEHPELFRAYPEMRGVTGEVIVDPALRGGEGFFKPPEQTLVGMDPPYIHAKGPEADRALSALLHESQHGIQNLERFAPGSNPTMAGRLVGPRQINNAAATLAQDKGLDYRLLPPRQRQEFQDRARLMAYAATAGEVEPRNVQHRWEKGIRQLPPFQTEQFPRSRQIVPTGQQRKRWRPAEPYQEGGAVEEEKGPPLPPAVVESWGDPFEHAAQRQARAVRPRSFAQEGRKEGLATHLIEKLAPDPSSPFDVAATVAGGPMGRAAKVGTFALGALLEGLSPAEAGRVKTLVELGVDPAVIRRILKGTAEQGGGTFPLKGPSPTEGLMMGKYSNVDPRSLRLPGGEELSRKNLEEFIRGNYKALQDKDRFIGTWRDPDTGITYAEVSQRFPAGDVRQATKFGERTGQIAGYNLGAGESFPVGNWEQFIRSPEFHKRMSEMEEMGHELNRASMYPRWWTNEPFLRVYGERRMPQVAGYTAATAPNAAPRENIQTMSEYMRRSIRGEPIVQPNWRVPEGTMSRRAGSEIGMEQSRIPNLQRAERGALEELQRNKVREEGAALMGDPGAVVIDRHQIRLSEAPERGIYASTQEGTIKSVPLAGGKLNDYEKLKREFTEMGARTKRDPADQSADIWSGIRHTIQQTDQLYGTSYRGSAIPGESYSYAEHMENLLEDKAKHLNISKQKLESELNKGNENLLSWLLATTPALYASYRQWQAPRDSASPSSAGIQRGGGEL